MKHLSLVIMALTLNGCALAQVTKVKGDQIEVCGNRWATSEDLRAEASNHGCSLAFASNQIDPEDTSPCQVFYCH